MRRAAALVLLAACSASSPPPTAMPIATATPTPTASATATATAKPACIVVDQDQLTGGPVDLEGTVYTSQHSHPNGSTFTFFGLRLTSPRCVKGDRETPKTDDVQLAPMDFEKEVARLDGKKVRVTGEAFPWHTAWHVRPVLVSVKSIAKQ